MVTSIPDSIDHKATPEQIEHIAGLIPDEWLEPSATGSAQQCVDRIRQEFAYGADAADRRRVSGDLAASVRKPGSQPGVSAGDTHARARGEGLRHDDRAGHRFCRSLPAVDTALQGAK